MTTHLGEKISVCLLTYNHAHVIESTLHSILEQTIDDFEVIVSDDCSTDGTWECIQALAAREVRVTAVRTARNLGMAGNANHAVAHSKRPYVALLHHDDIYRRDLLEKWAGVLERHSTAAFVFNFYGVYQSKHVYQVSMPGECIDGHWLLDHHLLARWGCVVRGTAMIRRSSWLRVGGMRESFGLLADVDLWMRLAMSSRVGHVAEPVIAIRHHRPDDYPDEYIASWSWRRHWLLYEIHAANRQSYWNLQTARGQMKWFGFRLKLSLETAKWLVYAVIRRKPEMIASSAGSETAYDLWPLRLFRWGLLCTYSSLPAHSTDVDATNGSIGT